MTKSRVFGIFIHVRRGKEVVKLKEFGIALLATVLGNIASHFIIEAVERRSAHRRDSPKHMR